jgi:L-threonylcarbamoyladenylate synthase
MRRVFVDAEAPQRDALQEAAKWIRMGGIIAIPTDTLYGLAVDPFRAEAVARVFSVKGREAGRALPLIAADVAQIQAHLGELTPLGQRLAEKFWPGPLTLVIPATPALADGVADSTGHVGVRVPADRVAREICRAADRPLTATSANRSGQPATADPDEVERTLGAALDLLIDAGTTKGGAPSTIVDVSTATPRLIRAGATTWDDIQTWLNGLEPLTGPAA